MSSASGRRTPRPAHRPAHRPARLRTTALLAVASAIVGAGCGIPLDDTPRGLTPTTTTTSVDEATTTTAGLGETTAGASAFVFFVADNQLVNLSIAVAGSAPAEALGALFAGVPAGIGDDVVSQIPTGTRLLSVRQVGATVVVDVSAELDNLVGTGRTQAIAQIVMTATDLTGVDQVALRIDGQATQVFSPVRGDTEQVSACDYVGLLPSEDVVATWPLDRRERQHLVTRRNMLLTQCPEPPSS